MNRQPNWTLAISVSWFIVSVSMLNLHATATDLVVRHKEFLFEVSPHPECHASTIEETANGTLIAAWFGGVEEKDPSA